MFPPLDASFKFMHFLSSCANLHPRCPPSLSFPSQTSLFHKLPLILLHWDSQIESPILGVPVELPIWECQFQTPILGHFAWVLGQGTQGMLAAAPLRSASAEHSQRLGAPLTSAQCSIAPGNHLPRRSSPLHPTPPTSFLTLPPDPLFAEIIPGLCSVGKQWASPQCLQ